MQQDELVQQQHQQQRVSEQFTQQQMYEAQYATTSTGQTVSQSDGDYNSYPQTAQYNTHGQSMMHTGDNTQGSGSYDASMMSTGYNSSAGFNDANYNAQSPRGSGYETQSAQVGNTGYATQSSAAYQTGTYDGHVAQSGGGGGYGTAQLRGYEATRGSYDKTAQVSGNYAQRSGNYNAQPAYLGGDNHAQTVYGTGGDHDNMQGAGFDPNIVDTAPDYDPNIVDTGDYAEMDSDVMYSGTAYNQPAASFGPITYANPVVSRQQPTAVQSARQPHPTQMAPQTPMPQQAVMPQQTLMQQARTAVPQRAPRAWDDYDQSDLFVSSGQGASGPADLANGALRPADAPQQYGQPVMAVSNPAPVPQTHKAQHVGQGMGMPQNVVGSIPQGAVAPRRMSLPGMCRGASGLMAAAGDTSGNLLAREKSGPLLTMMPPSRCDNYGINQCLHHCRIVNTTFCLHVKQSA